MPIKLAELVALQAERRPALLRAPFDEDVCLPFAPVRRQRVKPDPVRVVPVVAVRRLTRRVGVAGRGAAPEDLLPQGRRRAGRQEGFGADKRRGTARGRTLLTVFCSHGVRCVTLAKPSSGVPSSWLPYKANPERRLSTHARS